jgi:class 3 adenylate cyclase
VSGAEERKLATVLFADLVSSTATADGEDPERVRARLERFYDAMAEEIGRTGGTVEKFAGDAVMAAFGAPAALEDHAERALHAALAMQRRLGELFGGELRLRIGVNTGEVVVGQAREASSFVTGDAVNVAARLEQAAEAGEVLAGERTVAAVGGAFEFSEPRLVEAKGKPGGVACRAVLRALSLARPRGAGGFRRVFVGRESELDLLRATFRRTLSQQEPHLVTIVGEPGVGKTTLVRELWEMLAEEEPAPLRRTGRCLPYGDGVTYWPVGEALREHFGLLESDSPREALRRLEGREILGLALGLDVASDLHPRDARERLHASIVEFVEEIASERPLVLLVEDVHWAEDDLLDLLERLVRDARVPVVLVATSRPELFDGRPTWSGGWRNATTIWLDPLPAEVAARMVDEMLALELRPAVRDLVVGRAEGNPFFVEELVGALVDSGVLERRNGGWTVGELPEGFSVPDSVQAVLAARLDRLPTVEEAALQAASVVGRVFWTQPVVHLLDGEEPDFDLLEERDFIRRRAGSAYPAEREYAIKHALTREVAYSSIPKARRGRLHARLADWLEEGEQTGDEYVPLLAYHYAEAVRPEDADLVWGDDAEELGRLRLRAVSWLERAGRLARGRYEIEEAIELLTRAAELAGDDRKRALLWREIGYAQALRFDGEAFWDAMNRSLEGPLDDAERADTYSILAFQTSIRSGMWLVRPERAQVDEWTDRALELDTHGGVVRARALLGRAYAEPADVDPEVVIEAAALAEATGEAELRSYAFGARSHAAYARLDFEEASTWSERRLELVSELEDPDVVCDVYESAVPVAAAIGRFREAKRLVDEHGALSRRLSAHHRLHSVSLELELAEAMGGWEAIAQATDRVERAVADNLATPCVRNARDLFLCAVAHECLGSADRGRELERSATRMAGEGHDRTLNPPRLRLALVRGDADAVRTLVGVELQRTFVWGPAIYGTFLDALVALGEHAWIEDVGPALAAPDTTIRPFALRALGVARRDDALLAEADQLFRTLGLDWHADQTERLLRGL